MEICTMRNISKNCGGILEIQTWRGTPLAWVKNKLNRSEYIQLRSDLGAIIHWHDIYISGLPACLPSNNTYILATVLPILDAVSSENELCTPRVLSATLTRDSAFYRDSLHIPVMMNITGNRQPDTDDISWKMPSCPKGLPSRSRQILTGKS